MNLKKIMTAAAVLSAISFGGTTASAHNSVKAVFDGIYPGNTQACYICHRSDDGTNLIQYGIDYKNAGGPRTALNATDITAATNAINALDATYGATIAANALPDAAPASSSSSSGGCVTASVATPLMMVFAMLALGFFAGRKKG